MNVRTVSLLRRFCRGIAVCTAALVLPTASARAQDTQQPAPASSAATQTATGQWRISCASQAGSREHCAADTSKGVALVKSTGGGPCLLGKTWGYDDTGIWVMDG